jgi:hypothetical protein
LAKLNLKSNQVKQMSSAKMWFRPTNAVFRLGVVDVDVRDLVPGPQFGIVRRPEKVQIALQWSALPAPA